MARNIYYRKDGRFEGQYADGFNANGKPKNRSVFGKTCNEVKDKLEKAKSVSINLCSPTANKSTVIGAVSEYLNETKMRIKLLRLEFTADILTPTLYHISETLAAIN
jgi:hypothetical protein